MSEKIIAVLLSFGLLGGMFLWVPILEFVCPRCNRFFRSLRPRLPSPAEPREDRDEIAKVA